MTIDWWTLGFQTVNVAVLSWLLGHFFWTPIAGMIAARKVATQALTDGAAAAKSSADAALADVAKTRAGFGAECDTILAAAREDANAAHAARLAQAETEAAALLATTKAAIAKSENADTLAWADRASDLAIAIAQRLAARLDGAVVDECFLGWLVAAIGTMPQAARDAAGAKDAVLEATTAATLNAAARQHVVTAIDTALAGTPQINFRTDVALIAGIELRGEHLMVASSWRADLDAIRTDLAPTPAA